MNYLKKSKGNFFNKNGNPFSFFLLISFFPALVFTIIFKLLDIKTFFWSKQGTYRYRWMKGYIGVFFFLWGYFAFLATLINFLYFLFRIIREKPKQRKKGVKYLLIFFLGWIFVFLVQVFLIQNKKELGGSWVMSFFLLLNVISGIFNHYFFSQPVFQLIHRQYPTHFPKNLFTFPNWNGHRLIYSTAITWFIINFQILIFLLLTKIILY